MAEIPAAVAPTLSVAIDRWKGVAAFVLAAPSGPRQLFMDFSKKLFSWVKCY